MNNTITKYLKVRVPTMSLGLVIKFAGTAVELMLPWMLSVILDRFVPEQDTRSIILWGVLMIVAAGAALLGNIVANRIATRVARDFIREVRYDLFARITDLSCSQTDKFTVPSLISRLTSDSYNLHQMVDRMQRLGVRAPIMLLGGITITFMMEPVLTLVMIAVMPVLSFIVVFISKKGILLYTKTQAALDVMIRRAQESITGIRVIQALSKTGYEKNRFNSASNQVADNDYHSALLMNVTSPVMNILLNLGLTFVVVVGAFRVNGGHTGPGTIIAFLSYFTIILNVVMMISRIFVMLTKGVASGKRIAEVLDAPYEMELSVPADGEAEVYGEGAAGGKSAACGEAAADGKSAACGEAAADGEAAASAEAAAVETSGTYGYVIPHDQAYICFDNVSFSYSKVRNDLSNISFTLRRGEKMGIIGATGSGKSTLLQLLLRFYDPDSGSIRIDGKELRSIPPAVLYSMFGVVFQNDFLYADEISENIDIGRGLDSDRIIEAARNAQADFIFNRSDGFAGFIASGGMDISGGQKQRMLIARALAARPEILLLDDSSSALDYKTDAALNKALNKEYADTTKIIITQRVSAIIDAGKILVLDDGQMIGLGTHDELMRDCAMYREIATYQMQEVV